MEHWSNVRRRQRCDDNWRVQSTVGRRPAHQGRGGRGPGARGGLVTHLRAAEPAPAPKVRVSQRWLHRRRHPRRYNGTARSTGRGTIHVGQMRPMLDPLRKLARVRFSNQRVVEPLRRPLRTSWRRAIFDCTPDTDLTAVSFFYMYSIPTILWFNTIFITENNDLKTFFNQMLIEIDWPEEFIYSVFNLLRNNRFAWYFSLEYNVIQRENSEFGIIKRFEEKYFQ